jgi:60S ribosome subunit biogenesis protein NIP7
MFGGSPAVGKARLRRLEERELRVLEGFASSLGLKLSDIASNPMALQVPRSRYVDVFDVPEHLVELLEQLDSHYAAGMYLGYLEGDRFKPGLPLARKLSRLCGVRLCCIVLSEEGEKRFLYGRIVWESNVVNWCDGLSVVVNTLGEPLGWGLGVSEEGRRFVKPVWDLGWYLRRGG